jgi:hypothetical protein
MHRYRDGAAIEEIAGEGVLEAEEVEARVFLIGCKCRDRRRHVRRGRHDERIEARHQLVASGDEPPALDEDLLEIGIADRRARHDALVDALVVVLAMGGDLFALMPVGFGGRDAAPAVDERNFGEFGEREIHDRHAGVGQRCKRAVEGLGDRRLEAVADMRGGEAQSDRTRVLPFDFARPVARHDRIGNGAALDGLGERANGIERRGQGIDALFRYAPGARLVAGDAAIGSRDAARAAGVGAERQGHHAVGDGDRTSR